MKTLQITSTESLDAAVANVVATKIQLTELTAALKYQISQFQKASEPPLAKLRDTIADDEARILLYCEAHRAALFPDKKSRETNLAVFGFELTPWRVETSSKKIKWKDVVARLAALVWGAVYLRQPEAAVNKDALLADRTNLSEEQLRVAGIQFCQDEQFYLRPKPETAEASKT